MPYQPAYRDIYRSSVGPGLAKDAPAAPTTIYDTGLPAQQLHLVAKGTGTKDEDVVTLCVGVTRVRDTSHSLPAAEEGGEPAKDREVTWSGLAWFHEHSSQIPLSTTDQADYVDCVMRREKLWHEAR
ncbi:hypothetical protein INS49_008317 [Diaporthe citri]|uniref:uncharacterized protein n=1 Tax=Diaporthe citri TaxID=83186 RepID=UPI001C823B08|nr:uncharacterized protein INS49_008317 [Diaporthe citri]KAG6363221.1 hypothetical protein INS49_008317 [Diaporthe citri]